MNCLTYSTPDPLFYNQQYININQQLYFIMSSPDTLAIVIMVFPECVQDQVHIFQCTGCGSFWIHLSVIVYYSVHIEHNTLLNFVSWNLPKSFFIFLFSIHDVFHCQIAVKLFLIWQWCFIESMSNIHVLVWINTFKQHQTKFVNVSITESVRVLKFLC